MTVGSDRHRVFSVGLIPRSLVGLLLVACGACDGPERREVATKGYALGQGVTELAPEAPELTGTAGQTIYVPAYSAVATANNSQLYQLAITLSVRNTDRSLPIVVTSIRYFNQDGRLVRDFLKKPLRVAPLAALEFFTRSGDTSGGTASNFVLEWVGEVAVSAPLAETVMVGISSSQSISFTCVGRVVAERGQQIAPSGGGPPITPR